jgi:hypothetical protein
MTKRIPVQMAKALVKKMERVLDVYGHTCFTVRKIRMDGDFEKSSLFYLP